MNKYICTKCGSEWYSSAELECHKKSNCEKCGGKLTSNPTMGQRMRFARKKLNRTQVQIAKEIGSYQNSYNGYECDRLTPNIWTLSDIADALGVSVDYLLGRDDNNGR